MPLPGELLHLVCIAAAVCHYPTIQKYHRRFVQIELKSGRSHVQENHKSPKNLERHGVDSIAVLSCIGKLSMNFKMRRFAKQDISGIHFDNKSFIGDRRRRPRTICQAFPVSGRNAFAGPTSHRAI